MHLNLFYRSFENLCLRKKQRNRKVHVYTSSIIYLFDSLSRINSSCMSPHVIVLKALVILKIYISPSWFKIYFYSVNSVVKLVNLLALKSKIQKLIRVYWKGPAYLQRQGMHKIFPMFCLDFSGIKKLLIFINLQKQCISLYTMIYWYKSKYQILPVNQMT